MREQGRQDGAARVRAAFTVAKHATMATLRAGGAPRISGTEVDFADDGELRIGSMPGSRKARDLQRDPRVALHSPTADPGEDGANWSGEAKVAGRAIEEEPGDGGAHSFRLELTEVVREYLQDRYEVAVVHSGPAAMQAVAAQRPDVVFLDINMPGPSGLDVLKALRRVDASIPVVMVTVNTEVAVVQECLREGAFAYVPKPFDLKYVEHMAALATQPARSDA